MKGTADLAPLLVMDASGRVRHTYVLWQQNRNDLVRLPAASNLYHSLVVWLWKRSVGKDALARHPAVREEIADAIVEAVNMGPDEDWLIVTYQDSLPLLQREVEASLPPDSVSRVKWLNWGRHLGTNEFREVTNVVIVGQRTYPSRAYQAMALAAPNVVLSASDALDVTATRIGEHRHHLLQALCRASVRKSYNGNAGKCRAFVITSLGDAEAQLETIFPGVSIRQWREDALPTGRVDQAIGYLRGQFSDPAVREIRKSQLRDVLGIRSSPNLTRDVLGKHAFRHFLAEEGLENSRLSIRRTVSPFDSVPDGYVHDAWLAWPAISAASFEHNARSQCDHTIASIL